MNSLSEHKPIVTIITLTCNRPILLERAIRSVLSLNYESWEHVIVNNGGDVIPVSHILEMHSTEYQSRSRLIDLDESIPFGAALNVAVRSSLSTYVMVLDDDVSLEPDILLELTDALEFSCDSIKAVHCSSNIVEEYIDSNNISLTDIRDNPYQSGHANLYNIFCNHKSAPISYLIKRDAFNEIGFFDEKINSLPVWDYWIRLLSVSETLFVAEKLSNWHIRPSSKDEYGNLTYSLSQQELIDYRVKYLHHLLLNTEPSFVTALATLALANSCNSPETNESNTLNSHNQFSYRLLPKSLMMKLKNVLLRKIDI
jgi:GT2 family glycosyltransferase